MSSFLASWLTPTSLFLIVNCTIGTIALINYFTTPKNAPQHHQHGGDYPHQLVRPPSLLERVKSFNFPLYRSESSSSEPATLQIPDETPLQNPGLDSDQPGGNYPPVQLVRAPSLLERVKSFKLPNLSSLYRSESESSEPATHHIPDETPEQNSGWDSDSDLGNEHDEHHVTRTKSEPKRESSGVREKMKKSASEKMAARQADEEEMVERRRPETVRERKKKVGTASSGDDEEVDAKADDFINKFKQQLKLQRLDSLLNYREMLGRGT
ncbi:hypothetical protein L1049_021883 [Liquidambar formosana]|uniref:DUF4408 domain-containing protein n=1 Tax=Liquidambar formosana TaxID=63359 RepID=A0AAP0RBL0_LIQFO